MVKQRNRINKVIFLQKLQDGSDLWPARLFVRNSANTNTGDQHFFSSSHFAQVSTPRVDLFMHNKEEIYDSKTTPASSDGDSVVTRGGVMLAPDSIPKLGLIWKILETDYGTYGSQYSPKKSKEGYGLGNLIFQGGHRNRGSLTLNHTQNISCLVSK